MQHVNNVSFRAESETLGRTTSLPLIREDCQRNSLARGPKS